MPAPAVPKASSVTPGEVCADRQTDRHTEAYHIHQVLMVPTMLAWLLLSEMEKTTPF